MKGLRAAGWLAVGVLAAWGTPGWAQQLAGGAGCVPADSQQGVLLQSLIQQLDRDLEVARKAGNQSRMVEIAREAQATMLCGLPTSFYLVEAEALASMDRVCEAQQPLDRYFNASVPGDAGYGTAEALFERVRQTRGAGLCDAPVGGVALAEPQPEFEEPTPEGQAVPEDGSHRDEYRGGELLEGRQAFDSGNYGRAVDLFTIVIQQAPESFEGYLRRAQAHARLGNVPAAQADFTRAVELGAGRGYIVIDFARYMQSLDRFEDANALYNQYLERYPNDVQVLRERAMARQKAGLVELAIEDLSRAIDLAPGDMSYRLARAYVYHDNARFEDAVRDYTAAIEGGRADADTLYRRALAYYALNRVDEAIADYTAALEKNSKLAEAYRGRGLLYQYRGDSRGALADFSTLVDLRPDDVDAYIARARVYQRQLDVASALADYTEALRIVPGNLEARKGRAMLFQQQGEYNKAVEDLTQLINRDYIDADAYTRRGWVYHAWKSYDRALADFDKALVIDPNSTQAGLGRRATLEAIAAAQAAAEAAGKRR
ncbi:tetratricopeptide repeat protein [Iodidimonas sp. SYSU 1G8]|uniref:tetratricopeptide repeat protein n=1 Tax=Iodidimonas sp. SYSU 1G8 TaxID=3133967 RepID=UPI0031FEB6FF